MSPTDSISPHFSQGGSNTLADTLDRELLAAIRAWSLWALLGWNDIRQRYRRSVLGPFWITISMAVFIAVLGVIYARLFNVDIRTYLPYLSLGYVIWGFISATVMESCGAFQEGERIIKQIKLPYPIYVLRVVWRNLIVLLHTIVIFIPIALIFSVNPGLGALRAIPGLILLYLNLVWVALTLAILCARYRDLVQIVTTGVQIMLFATPIMWPAEMLQGASYIADINPLHHILEVVRGPLLGKAVATLSWTYASVLAIVGWTGAIFLLHRASRRIVFWI